MKKISILGSTGSIGTQAISIIKNNSQFKILYLSAYSNAELLIKQTKEFEPKSICIVDKTKLHLVKDALSAYNVEILSGTEGVHELASKTDIDLMLNALVGYSGMAPTLLALENGIDVALANKESLVVGGNIIKKTMTSTNTNLFPVDSEHSAIWQCLLGEQKKEVRKLILTGSGGPFRTLDINKFNSITKHDALKHPNWSMGQKITIDSATMMNKGLEVIEAYWLFDISIDKIDIVIHPQSIIHSMVEFIDGSIKAQLGIPSMNIPIHFALHYPERMVNKQSNFNFLDFPKLEFEKPDFEKFKCIELAYSALKLGDSYPIALNVANDLCVAAFLKEQIRFIDIPNYIEETLAQHTPFNIDNIESIFHTINDTKEYIKQKIGN